MKKILDPISRRRMMMGKASSGENYDEWLWCSFTLAESMSGCQITGSESMDAFDRVIVDGVELTMANSITQTLDAGSHKIMWHPIRGSLYQGNVPNVLSPDYTKGSNKIVNIPASITSIADFAMRGYPLYTLYKAICRATTPPTCPSSAANALWMNTASFRLYVPDDSINAYKAATGWSQYASRTVGLSTL